MSINKAILIGNLGSDPEVRTTTSGKQVASFSLATSERYKDRTTGEAKSITEWHNIVLWSNLAEIAGKFLKKGSKVYIEGRIKTRSYDSNGTKKYITEIIGDNLTMLGEHQRPTTNVIESSGHEALNASSKQDESTEELPF